MVADSLWGSTPMNTRAMPYAFRRSDEGLRGGHCYYERGSPLWSHASARHPAGAQTGREPHPLMVGSRMESVPPSTWTESGRTPVLSTSCLVAAWDCQVLMPPQCTRLR